MSTDRRRRLLAAALGVGVVAATATAVPLSLTLQADRSPAPAATSAAGLAQDHAALLSLQADSGEADVAHAGAAIEALDAGAGGADAAAALTDAVTLETARPTAYVVNVGTGAAVSAGRMRSVAAAVSRAGGTVVQQWPQIGVLVVHSTRADFTRRLAPSAQTRVTSVGPTRGVPVTETVRATRATAPRPAAAAAAVAASRAGAEPREREQWGLRAVRAAGTGSRPAAAAVPPRSLAGVTVAVVDSGIEPDHPDLRGRIDTARSLDCTSGGRPDYSGTRWRNTTSGHGTHVAGIIAAARNGVGVAGVAPGVRVSSVKVVNDDGFIYPEYAICGIISAAASGARIANHSYFVDPWHYWCSTDPRQAAGREAVRRAFAWSTGRGTLSVAAAGNEGVDLSRKTVDDASPGDGTPVTRKLNSTCLDIPAELPGVVTVSAADPNGQRAAYSNYGRGVVDIMAPGSDVLSTYPNRTWAPLSGTSMAAPHAAGVLALLAARQPRATPAQLTASLLRQARDVPCPRGSACVGTPARNSFAGEGMVDASRAVR